MHILQGGPKRGSCRAASIIKWINLFDACSLMRITHEFDNPELLYFRGFCP